MMVVVLGLVSVWGPGVQADVVIDTVTVGNPGNDGEWSGESYGGYYPRGPDRICGAVDYTYEIGKYEVTAGQYTAFLNAVAATDTYELYDTTMWSSSQGCQIERTGSPGSYTYSVAPDRANRPVTKVSFWDACRFVNWLDNGQPTGEQGAGTTETGAYTLDGHTGPTGQQIHRNPSCTWAVPSEDEWYKAAYHKNDGVTDNYFFYPTSSDSVPSNDLINPDPGNNANFTQGGLTIGSPYWRTEVGAFENTDGPYGTFDMGGNVAEWNETVVTEGPGYSNRGARGGSCTNEEHFMRAPYRNFTSPNVHGTNLGFRVVMVPEPGCLTLVVLGGAMLLRRRGLGS